jgi:hypothetical protein
MNNVDFSDINKFFTSLGLILIGLALFFPWYIHQNINILLIEKESLNKTTCIAKNVLQNQQEYLFTLNKCLPFIMVILIIVGIALIIFGLINWKARQKVIYGIQDEEWRLKKSEGISKEEKKEMIGSEIKSTSELDKQKKIQQYIQIEDSIYLKLSRRYAVNYIVEQNIRIDRYNFDIILKSKYINKRSDIILEIKYFKQKITNIQLLSVTRLFLMSISHYEQALQRPQIIPILVIVFDSNEVLNELKDSKQKMKGLANNHGVNNLRIIYVLKDQIDSSEPGKFIKE